MSDTPRTDALIASFPETGDAATPYTCMKLLHHAQAIERELAAANARLAFRGKETDGAFCDSCAAWENMAWEATVKLKAIEAALAAAKAKE